ncbi:MAG: lactate racemase domain-containing protein, partial [Mycobacteriaceae bacterium]
MATFVHPRVADHYGTEPGDPKRTLRLGGVGEHLSPAQVTEFVEQAFATVDLDGKRVCLVVPDGTRTCPLPLLMGAVHGALAGRATTVTVLIALGTHQEMSEEHLARHLGYQPGQSERTYPG